ncbi:MAG: sigma-70 family RNA polymerase sigma factor [Acidobacteriota bacterium]
MNAERHGGACQAAPPPPPEPLTTLFERLSDGDATALSAVYETAASEIHGLALFRTRSAADAADVVQDVFVKLAQQGAKLRAIRNPRAWLLTVTRRAAIDVLRKRSKDVEIEEAALLAGPGSVEEWRADAGRLSEALHRLSDQQREVLYLKHFSELSFAEIGKTVGVPTFTAASRYRLGLKRLRKMLDADDD